MHKFAPLALPAALTLAACSTPEGYPTLSVRDSERASVTMNTPQTPQFSPAPPAATMIARLDELVAGARDAHARFLSAADGARGPVRQAQGSAMGSIRWSEAQVAIASLQSISNNAVVALADIDRLYIDAALEGGEVRQLEAARAEISALVDDENRLLDAMITSLAS